uniref:ARID domain-containing protein n=2 Tax=Macrostomum lignano TaxID=282301 RepID=A0A1I8GWD8_9PLAT
PIADCRIPSGRPPQPPPHRIQFISPFICAPGTPHLNSQLRESRSRTARFEPPTDNLQKTHSLPLSAEVPPRRSALDDVDERGGPATTAEADEVVNDELMTEAERDFLLAQQEFFAHHHQQLLAREAAAAVAASVPFLQARPGGLPLPLGLGRPPAPPPLPSAQMPPPPPSSSSALMPPTSGLLGRSDGEEEQRGGTPESLTPPPSEKVGLGLGDDGSPDDSDAGHHWTFEEQFKQLYELSEEPKRKQFLDDLFAFMQRRGTPVNRIPIMAKQVLDLYELFRLVVSKGGLVEVINKKLWREITKGLNLPYMKYLYPYECEKLKLSSPGELQAAIDGNRREGRRPNYPAFECSPNPGGLPPLLTYHSSMLTGKAMSDRDFACLTPPVLRATPGDERHHQHHQPHPHHHHALHPQNLSDASPKDLSSAAVAAAANKGNGAGGGGSLKRSSSGSDTAGVASFVPGGVADHQPPPPKRPTANGSGSSSAGDTRSPPPPITAGVGNS